MRRLILILLFAIPLSVFAQPAKTIEIGSFNIEWFPCKDDGEMMKKYNINLRRPPHGEATNTQMLFEFLKQEDIELLGVVEIVDPQLLDSLAKVYLGPQFKVIYAPSASSQKVGFLYDSSVLEIVGQPEVYSSVTLKPGSWLRPAFRAYFKVKPDGFDFHAIITHLKAAPSGWKTRKKQWNIALKNILNNLQTQSPDKDIILMGDFNNVSKLGYQEFLPVIKSLHFTWLTQEIVDRGLFTDYWSPYELHGGISGSVIDQIFISSDMTQEYVPHSVNVGGMCARGKKIYQPDEIPDYYKYISDHCPVFATFRADVDNDK